MSYIGSVWFYPWIWYLFRFQVFECFGNKINMILIIYQILWYIIRKGVTCRWFGINGFKIGCQLIDLWRNESPHVILFSKWPPPWRSVSPILPIFEVNFISHLTLKSKTLTDMASIIMFSFDRMMFQYFFTQQYLDYITSMQSLFTCLQKGS